ncbi:MAG: YggS family pyridoxal phosphate-dependent enzyme [Gammaproteobacteria bacterium]|nr:YggS family pyridoxal phosphate-dependent enzyme [Gammaproteobacteria bacterium]
MNLLSQSLQQVESRIREAERLAQRETGSVSLLAVSKRQPDSAIREMAQLGVIRFGESYLQEALLKLEALQDLQLEWHFIGPIQANKCRDIASHFSWVHSVDRRKIGERLNNLRPAELPPLNILLQVNISAEANKAGCPPAELAQLAADLRALPRLRLRGLMAIPRATPDPEAQRSAFRQLRLAQERLQREGHQLDTLSMGMSNDLEMAVAEGSTIVRIGTALFGERV